MRRIFIISIISLITSCGDNRNTTKSTPLKKWYEGGNLHNSLIYEWKNSTEENKLATCSDFIAYIDKTVSMDILLERSVELRACINEATKGIESANNEKVADIATLCIITLGYK
jgi:hypothetical protein